MFRRAVLATIILSLTAVGTTACNMISPVASMIEYAPSDGTQGDLGTLKARNVMILTNGSNSALFGAFVNESPDPIEFAIAYNDDSNNKSWRQFSIKPYQVIHFGSGSNPLNIPIKVKAGAIEEITVGNTDGSITLNVPVLDASIPQYKELVAELGN